MINNTQLPILYSFRRCPYAMRARLGIAIAQVPVEIREILLRDKPDEMVMLSPKATVPVLQLVKGEVLDESLDIMYWALTQSPQNTQAQQLMNPAHMSKAKNLIKTNDEQFKANLDRYKYAVRFPEKTEQDYRTDCENFLRQLEQLLEKNQFLCGDQLSVADIGIFPFIRQFAGVDRQWFEASRYTHLRKWLKQCVESEKFIQVMKKFPLWKENRPEVTVFP